MSPRSPIAAAGLVVFTVSAASCATAPDAAGLDSPVPATRMAAIRRANAEGERSPATVRGLIEQLDSDDAAVRLLAISTLERLTGETRGYQHNDPVALRRAAIDRWLTALPAAEPAIDPTGRRSGVDDHG